MNRAALQVEDGETAISNLMGVITRSIVDIPHEVSVEVLKEVDRTVVRLRVDPSDIGKVVGKQGRTARSLRTILSAAGMKLKRHFWLEIMEDNQRPNAKQPGVAHVS